MNRVPNLERGEDGRSIRCTDQVLVGQKWRDKDKRTGERVVVVTGIDTRRQQAHVRNLDNGHMTSVDLTRLRKRYSYVGEEKTA